MADIVTSIAIATVATNIHLMNTGVLKMQAQRKNASGDESNCLLLILPQILNFHG